MNNLEQYIHDKLDAMQTEKAKQPIEPNWVTKGELLGAIDKDIRKTLNKMFHAGQIKVHKTKDPAVNDYVELVID